MSGYKKKEINYVKEVDYIGVKSIIYMNHI